MKAELGRRDIRMGELTRNDTTMICVFIRSHCLLLAEMVAAVVTTMIASRTMTRLEHGRSAKSS